MSDDDGWFSSENSSNDADGERRLEAVPPPPDQAAEEWFGAELSEPAAEARPPASSAKSGNRKTKLLFAGSIVAVLRSEERRVGKECRAGSVRETEEERSVG